MKEKDVINVDVKLIITMCYILEQFNDFNEKLAIYLEKDKYSIDTKNELIDKLSDVSHNKKCYFGKKAQNFYENNKEIIDIINKNIGIRTYISSILNVKYLEQLNYIYSYIVKNKDKLDVIITNLEKIDEISNVYIKFHEDLDFNDELYYLDKSDRSYTEEIVYLENLESVPRYRHDVIFYKSSDSSYKITCAMIDRRFLYCTKFSINDLTIDSKRLPEKISKESVYNQIEALSLEKETTYNDISNAINLSVGLDDLSLEFEKFNQIVDKIDRVSNKDELIKILSEIKSRLVVMQEISREHDKNIIENDAFITSELLDEEKKLYIKAKNDSRLD